MEYLSTKHVQSYGWANRVSYISLLFLTPWITKISFETSYSSLQRRSTYSLNKQKLKVCRCEHEGSIKIMFRTPC